MKKLETNEESKLIKEIEDWRFESLKWSELEDIKTDLIQAAKNTTSKLSRRKAINIRLLEDDIIKLKAISLNKWIPYQTYLAQIVHDFTTWKLKS